jgi:hypothetical protein
MKTLILTIIKRMEDMQTKSETEVFTTERKVVKLDENKVSPTKKGRGGKDTCC